VSTRVSLTIGALLLASASVARADVAYRVDLTAPEHHTAKIGAIFPAGQKTLDVIMPAWRTGRYQIQNLANGVSRFVASDAAGRPLAWQKTDKSTWRIVNPGGGEVRIGYELYANELGRRSRHIDDSHAYLDASAVFMYTEANRSEPVSVALSAPAAWKSFSGMERDDAGRFVAPNWDILVDSPIETGINQSYRFKADGRDYDVVFWGKGNADERQIVADLQKIVPASQSIWRGYPFRRYLFIYHLTDGEGGATEHVNSTVIQFPRYTFKPRDNYLGVLGTSAHEFVHTWNVKDYRSAPMVPYDYTKENYSELLWLEEGSTEYFADHLLLRAGLMQPSEYFETLAALIDSHRHRPGRLVQSVAEGSFEEWIKQGGDYGQNVTVDIYRQGAVASWALDIALLQQTGGKVSYRDVHQALYRKFGGRRAGFTDADILIILKELTGQDWGPWWQRHVRQAGETDFDALLTPVGLRMAADPPKGESATRGWAGWSGAADGGVFRLTLVEQGGPAWDAGFGPDDILVAIDGHRVTADRFAAALAEKQPGDSVTVSFFRRDQLMQKTLKLGSAPRGKLKIVPVAYPSAAQRALFRRWLLIDLPKA